MSEVIKKNLIDIASEGNYADSHWHKCWPKHWDRDWDRD